MLRKKVKTQEDVIEMLSNTKVVKGLFSALEDVKQGRYIEIKKC